MSEQPRQSTCPACGAPILRFKDVALDLHESMAGENRFVIRDGELRPVTKQANVLAYTDHRKSCPRAKKEVTHGTQGEGPTAA